ncbi:MAG TPA: hypothetical protein VMH48_04365 [Methylomirabilota bacterium]|nr:hypothetical protein [Methylomirabilota bacterium]
MSSPARSLFAVLTGTFLLPMPSFAFETPLSDQAVREAYFLGQRRDESMANFLNRYTQFPPTPDSGPWIYSVTFLTPFALVVKQSSQRPNYSAQQAEKDHDGANEIVSIAIQILLTPSYASVIPKRTGSRSDSPIGLQPRSPDFWKDFTYSVFDGDKELKPETFTGEPVYTCADQGGCDLTGANIYLQFPAKLFTSGAATVEVDPKVADPTSIDFDLDNLR